MCILLNLRSSADSIPSALTIFKPAYLPHPMLRTQEPVDDSCVFAQKSQQQVLRLYVYVRANVLKVVKMFLQSMEIVFLCMLQQEVQGTFASITIERRTGRLTGRRGAERAKTALSEAVSALCRLRPLPPRLSRVEPGRWQNACSVLIDRKRPSKSALSRCSDSIRRTP
jgi:hypothetical protein